VRPARSRLLRLLRPQSVAFVGGSVAPLALRACEASGFAGPLWAVHPTRAEVGGRRTFPSVTDLPDAPDAAFVAVNAVASVELVRALASCGAGGAVLYAAGFGETGTAEGAALDEALREAAGDMPVLGPNCYGLIDHVDGVSLWPVPYPRRTLDRGVAVVLQSGNLGINVTMSQRSVPIAFVASVGNQTVVEIAEIVDAYLDMPEVTAVAIYLEGLRDVPRFAAVASRALERRVPVAVCKAGTSDLGSELAYTHTASLAGADELYDALFERYGVARAATVPGLLEMVKALATTGPLPGRRAAVFTCSGAESALAADGAETSAIQLPQPSPGVRAALADVLPPHALVGNPLDYGNALWGQEESLQQVFSTALRDPVDIALLAIDYPLPGIGYATDVDAAISALATASDEAGVAAAVTSILPESFPEAARERALTLGVCPLQGLDDALEALAACSRLGERLGAGPPPDYPLVPDCSDTPRPLDERAAKELLSVAGIRVPVGRLVSPQQAAPTAAAIGFPVVVKLASAALPHKADAGAVELGLRSEQQVEAAVRRMLDRNPSVEIDGVLVERSIDGAVGELHVGARLDASFGHFLVVASGGTMVELMDDAVPLLLPVTRREVEAALRSLRSWRRLATGDADAAVDAVLALAGLVEAEGARLVEIEINPLLVLGRGVVAVDALCRVVPSMSA
jgi:acetate---CoA ligase (ADP-forming)